MKKVSKKVYLSVLVLALLVAGSNILRMENAEANSHRLRYSIALVPTSIRTSATSPTVTSLRTLAAASLRRTTAAPVQANGWTWIRGELSAHMNDSRFQGTTGANSVNYHGQNVWISTSQLTDVGGNSPAGVCRIRLGDTALRHAPGNGVSGSVARIPSGADFHLAGDATVTNGGFRWRLGVIRGNGTNTRSTLDGTLWNGRMMWIATTQLTDNATCR